MAWTSAIHPPPNSLGLGGATNPQWAWRKCQSTCKAALVSCCEQGRQMGSEKLILTSFKGDLIWWCEIFIYYQFGM